MGNEINSAKQIREMYSNGNETIRYQIIRELYPYSTKVGKIKEILDRVLNNSKKIDESVFYPNGYDKILCYNSGSRSTRNRSPV